MSEREFLAIMQPYYFPSASHFSLYFAASSWVIFDLPVFQKKTFVSRNYFATPMGSVSTISLEIPNSCVGEKIFKVHNLNLQQSKNILLGNISKHKIVSKRATDVSDLVNDVFSGSRLSLVDINERILLSVANYLGFHRPTMRASAINNSDEWDVSATDWAPLISSKLNFSNYLNPEGGRSFLKDEAFNQRNVNLFYHRYNGNRLPTLFGEKNLPDLSILNHLLLFEPEEVREQLGIYSIDS